MALTEEHLIPHPGVQSRWVRLANGARCHYMTGGDTGPAVILLHGGINGSSGMAGWGRWMIPHLAKEGFRVYAPDQPAFGLADTREEYWPRYGTLSHVEFVKDFADALCIDRFHIDSIDRGVGQQAAVDHRRIRKQQIQFGVTQHQFNALRRIAGVQRHVSGARFQYRQHTGEHGQ